MFGRKKIVRMLRGAGGEMPGVCVCVCVCVYVYVSTHTHTHTHTHIGEDAPECRRRDARCVYIHAYGVRRRYDELHSSVGEEEERRVRGGSLSLSLSLTHTHTHIHTQSLTRALSLPLPLPLPQHLGCMKTLLANAHCQMWRAHTSRTGMAHSRHLSPTRSWRAIWKLSQLRAWIQFD